MQSSGTAEGLRGLIDMSILKSTKKIIEYRGLFGPSILPIGMSYFASLGLRSWYSHLSDQHYGHFCPQ